ncbi:Hint domain-containing protein [Rhodobacter capsulatus]|uniref:Hint domain-containing protein n=1 Tax=Rhodobacter capsulatus TaxID=1061 RepID=UPI0003D3738E|nr:Hint domain-containing protein [Rhodobacter capsulatus]ETD87374.1 hemolysin-type calcium-binding protein [Rhodobacter capsulatus B6]
MKPGYLGTFVIAWDQTEIDGAAGAPVESLATGACWRWSGEAVRVDGPTDLLILSGAEGSEALRQRAARVVRRLLGVAIEGGDGAAFRARADLPELPDQSFAVTDGIRAYDITLIELPAARARLLMFAGGLPPRDTDLWLVESRVDPRPAGLRLAAPGVICFTPGTLIDTPAGPRPVEALRPGDRVSTRDDGAQEILWIGSRRMSGARLYALPHLRPVRLGAVRLRAGAPGLLRPAADLLVSPQHRVLVRGAAARALFNEPEVLVQACDLVDDAAVRVATRLPEVTYLHLLFARHQVIRANGIETESFHPAATEVESIAEDQRQALLRLCPGIEADPMTYGPFARRLLSASEAAILRHDLAA